MKTMFENEHPARRVQLLEDNCDSSVVQSYLKPLSEEELNHFRSNLAQDLIEVRRLEDDLKAKKDEIGQQIKALKKSSQNLLDAIKVKQIQASGRIYNFYDYTSGMVESYDSSGVMVESRKLRPEERQTSIKTLNQREA